MAEVSIKGTTRTEFGKGASRRARVAGLVPAVIYGHGEKPVHITLPARELGVALKESNVLLNIDIDGRSELTLPKSVVRHPLNRFVTDDSGEHKGYNRHRNQIRQNESIYQLFPERHRFLQERIICKNIKSYHSRPYSSPSRTILHKMNGKQPSFRLVSEIQLC